jgi:UDP-N-acetylglucosamine 1-carboxyvinyltransferase
VLTLALIALYAFGTHQGVVLVLIALWGFAVAQTPSIFQARVLDVAPGRTDVGLAWFGTAYNVGIAAGALTGGLLLPHTGVRGTYLIGAALTGGDVTLASAEPADLAPLLSKLAEVGAEVAVEDGGIRVRANGRLTARDLETAPHPGFPTDLQAQYMALMTQAEGEATIRETIFENRFQHAPELARMGADVRVEGGAARVQGKTPLSGAHVMATDLRASACLVLAGLAARGETVVDRIYHLDRGYEGMELKLQSLGARVARLAESPS